MVSPVLGFLPSHVGRSRVEEVPNGTIGVRHIIFLVSTRWLFDIFRHVPFLFGMGEFSDRTYGAVH